MGSAEPLSRDALPNQDGTERSPLISSINKILASDIVISLTEWIVFITIALELDLANRSVHSPKIELIFTAHFVIVESAGDLVDRDLVSEPWALIIKVCLNSSST
jgi:hypothetical protein